MHLSLFLSGLCLEAPAHVLFYHVSSGTWTQAFGLEWQALTALAILLALTPLNHCFFTVKAKLAQQRGGDTTFEALRQRTSKQKSHVLLSHCADVRPEAPGDPASHLLSPGTYTSLQEFISPC